jgi:hypothetical protein
MLFSVKHAVCCCVDLNSREKISTVRCTIGLRPALVTIFFVIILNLKKNIFILNEISLVHAPMFSVKLGYILKRLSFIQLHYNSHSSLF